ncbi:hypothetical protein FOHLNKBM_6296 [Methylobacterium longum]|nr:hypothetical protein FOHLNKBM_6296 [Methylobacterium longum]
MRVRPHLLLCYRSPATVSFPNLAFRLPHGRYHYASHDELRQHLQLFVDAYNYGRRLKTLRGLTPFKFICQTWTKEPERFRLDPSHYMLGPNIVAMPLLAGQIALSTTAVNSRVHRPRETVPVSCGAARSRRLLLA